MARDINQLFSDASVMRSLMVASMLSVEFTSLSSTGINALYDGKGNGEIV